jgi:hypothetical protein
MNEKNNEDNQQEEECKANHRVGKLLVVCSKCKEVAAYGAIDVFTFRVWIESVENLDTKDWDDKDIAEQASVEAYSKIAGELPVHIKCGQQLKFAVLASVPMPGFMAEVVSEVEWKFKKLSDIRTYIYKNYVKEYKVDKHDLFDKHPEQAN